MEVRIGAIVRHYAAVDIDMNAVERIRAYTVELPQEIQGGKEPPAHWPSRYSGIQVENLAIRYAENLKPALKGVSFDVKPSVSVVILFQIWERYVVRTDCSFCNVFRSESPLSEEQDRANLPWHSLSFVSWKHAKAE